MKFKLPNRKWTDGERWREGGKAIRNGAAGGAPPESDGEGEGRRERNLWTSLEGREGDIDRQRLGQQLMRFQLGKSKTI